MGGHIDTQLPIQNPDQIVGAWCSNWRIQPLDESDQHMVNGLVNRHHLESLFCRY